VPVISKSRSRLNTEGLISRYAWIELRNDQLIPPSKKISIAVKVMSKARISIIKARNTVFLLNFILLFFLIFSKSTAPSNIKFALAAADFFSA
jgi:hypothetical protein